MKIKQLKQKDITRVSDLLHGFMHRNVNGLKKGNYSVSEDGIDFNCRSTVVARFINNKKLYIAGDCSNKSTYGNGINSYFIRRCVPGTITPVIIPCINLNTLSKQNVINHYLCKILQAIYNYERQFKNKNCFRFTNVNILTDLQDKAKKTFKELKITKEYIKNTFPNKPATYVSWYKGWTSEVDRYTGQHPTWKYFYKPIDYLIDEQIREDVKNKAGYINLVPTYSSPVHVTTRILSYSTYLKRKDEPNFKIYLEGEKLKLEQLGHQQKLKYADEQAAKVNGQFEEWLNGKTNHCPLRYPTFLRLDPTDNTKIESSLNVKWYVTEGKKCYDLFNSILHNKNHILFAVNNLGSMVTYIPKIKIKMGNYKVDAIINDLTLNHWAIKAGCHYVLDSEIKRFIEFNKLDW